MGWIGRHHWKLVISQSFRGRRNNEPRGRYLPYPLAFWTLVICTIVMIVWMMLAGATFLAASVSIVLLLVLFLVITRLVAEAGLVHGQLQVPIYKPWVLLARAGLDYPIPTQSYYLASFLQCQHYDFREVVPVYASHDLKVADETIVEDQKSEVSNRKTARGFIAVLALALVVGYFVSFASTLWSEYEYAWTQDTVGRAVNYWGVENPTGAIVGSTLQYERHQFVQPHSSGLHVSIGFGVTALLSFLRLRFTWFPLHPIGYLMLDTFPSDHLWLSFFVGWLIKILIVRFGGPRGFVASRPFFLGLIVGESLAAGFWLVMGIVLSSLGLPYRPVNIMPG
jgi:hypothetical protein